MNYQTTDEAAADILRIIEDEAQALGESPVIEKHRKGNIANEIIVSLKHSGQTFRITME